MSNTGPIPKRSEERRRRNARTEAGESVEVEELVIVGEAPYLSAPEANPDWDVLAIELYEAALDSAQAVYYEPSDIAALRLLCESISRDLGEQFVGATEEGGPIYERIPMKGASLSAYLKAFGSLMLLEGDRRRLRLEIKRRDVEAAVAKAITDADVVADRNELFTPQVIQGGKTG